MKEFGKWEQNIQESFNTQMARHNARFEGWKAALEWVLNHVVYDPNDTGADWGLISNIDFIEDELKNEY